MADRQPQFFSLVAAAQCNSRGTFDTLPMLAHSTSSTQPDSTRFVFVLRPGEQSFDVWKYQPSGASGRQLTAEGACALTQKVGAGRSSFYIMNHTLRHAFVVSGCNGVEGTFVAASPLVQSFQVLLPSQLSA
eukprot:12303440-Karenia_brevis.AAC.1